VILRHLLFLIPFADRPLREHRNLPLYNSEAITPNHIQEMDKEKSSSALYFSSEHGEYMLLSQTQHFRIEGMTLEAWVKLDERSDIPVDLQSHVVPQLTLDSSGPDDAWNNADNKYEQELVNWEQCLFSRMFVDDSHWKLSVLPDGRVRFWLLTAGGDVHTRISLTVLQHDTWYHVALVYQPNSGGATIFVNGLLDIGQYETEVQRGSNVGAIRKFGLKGPLKLRRYHHVLLGKCLFDASTNSHSKEVFFKGSLAHPRVWTLGFTPQLVRQRMFLPVRSSASLVIPPLSSELATQLQNNGGAAYAKSTDKVLDSQGNECPLARLGRLPRVVRNALPLGRLEKQLKELHRTYEQERGTVELSGRCTNCPLFDHSNSSQAYTAQQRTLVLCIWRISGATFRMANGIIHGSSISVLMDGKHWRGSFQSLGQEWKCV